MCISSLKRVLLLVQQLSSPKNCSTSWSNFAPPETVPPQYWRVSRAYRYATVFLDHGQVNDGTFFKILFVDIGRSVRNKTHLQSYTLSRVVNKYRLCICLKLSQNIGLSF